jgi:hypothetical protein
LVARAAATAQADPWHHAVRVAFLTSIVASAAFVVLYRLVGVSPWVAVPLLVFAAWLVGCHLPAVTRNGGSRPGPGLRLVVAAADDVDDSWDEDLAA